MRKLDEQVKRQQDEVIKVRNEYNSLARKEGGNLTVKDFTDDIYGKGFQENKFCPETSAMFCNLIVVVPITKTLQFRESLSSMMRENYIQSDQVEESRMAATAE